MNILVVDGQGGQLGSQIVKSALARFPEASITAVGTNASAAAAMKKAGATHVASGENPAIVASKKADFIIGPIGIVIADSMLGEVTPNIAVAIGQSSAVRILIPINRCDNLVAGVSTVSLSLLIEDAIEKLDLLRKKLI